MKKKILFLIILCLFSGFIFYRLIYRPQSWEKYYQEHIKVPVRPLLLQALKKLQPSVGIALDLGAGTGNETLYLLKQGWTIYAIDVQPSAICLIEQRAKKENIDTKLTAIQENFENIDWNTLPNFDLILASYSLPFVEPKTFASLWQHITNHLNPGGIFVLNLFTKDCKKFSSSLMQSMTLLTTDQVNELLKPFYIHYYKKDAETFDIIAVKKY